MIPARLLLCLALAGAVPASAQVQRIESPGHRVTLLELFTSEGCSSCPPAEKWVNALENDPRLWERLVPVAFHVDYWDYIGWPDRFASPAYSQRQREHARRGGLGSVYTPGFVVHGEEWRGWFRYPSLDLASPPPAGIITLDVAADGLVAAAFTAAQVTPQPLELHLALLGFDLRTRVEAGENAGRTLEHHFVVLGYGRTPMVGASPRFTATARVPAADTPAPRHALAAWVSRQGDPRPLQSAGGWLAR